MPHPSASTVSPDQDMDQEVHDLLAFLRDFEIVPHSAKKAASPPTCRPLSGSATTTILRQPLGTLQSNLVHDIETYSDEEQESITTAPSMAKVSSVRRSWADRMSQAMSDWKQKHERLAQRRLVEQRKQLQMEHERELDKVRDELHRYYRQELRAWQEEYLSSSSSKQTTRAGGEQATPMSAPLADRSSQQSVVRDSVNHSSTATSVRQRWKSPEGKEITRYGNGTRREKNPDGSIVIRFSNGDVQTLGSWDASPTKLCYYYGSSEVLRMDQADGSVNWIFPNGQRERHFPDGTVTVLTWAP